MEKNKDLINLTLTTIKLKVQRNINQTVGEIIRVHICYYKSNVVLFSTQLLLCAETSIIPRAAAPQT